MKTTTPTKRISPSARLPESRRDRAWKLGLYGLVAHWDEIEAEPWIEKVLSIEETERGKRSLERRLANARIGRFKAMADFDWSWPKKIDRKLVDEVLRLGFLQEAANVLLLGPNGVGKSMIARNLAHQAVLAGSTARFTTASELLNDLASQETGYTLARALRRYVRPQLLVIDEVGYLASTAKHADLLFEVVTRRYQDRSTVITTNKPFGEWNQVFPNAGCVVTLVDRLIHRCEIVEIQGESYRLKEARERQARNAQRRRAEAKS